MDRIVFDDLCVVFVVGGYGTEWNVGLVRILLMLLFHQFIVIHLTTLRVDSANGQLQVLSPFLPLIFSSSVAFFCHLRSMPSLDQCDGLTFDPTLDLCATQVMDLEPCWATVKFHFSKTRRSIRVAK
jgi:hypothetical protein